MVHRPVLRTDTLFRRTIRLNYLSELSEGVKGRLYATSVQLGQEEERVRGLLGLITPPRLSLVDEESASLISGRERETLAEQWNRENRQHEEEEAQEGDWGDPDKT